MQKALSEMNLHLHKVLTNITGLTGMRIIHAIIAGEHTPSVLASMRDRRVKKTESDIAKALQGDYRVEHLFALKQAVELYEYYHHKVRECDIEIEKCLQQFESKIDQNAVPLPPSNKKHRRQGNTPCIDLREHYYRITGVDFTQINGIDILSVQTIISEVGLNPHAFPSEKHFSSWLGLCPNNRVTGGKVMRTSSRKVVNRAADAFRIAACTLANSSCALGGFYRRMRGRKGAPKAITATAHKLAVLFYRIWKTGDVYVDPGADYYEKKYRERVLANMKKRAKSLGYELSLQPSS
jgi:transposase